MLKPRRRSDAAAHYYNLEVMLADGRGVAKDATAAIEQSAEPCLLHRHQPCCISHAHARTRPVSLRQMLSVAAQYTYDKAGNQSQLSMCC